MLTLGSLFDGISTWQIAATNNGIKPIWSSEIDAFPMAVSKHHFPNTKQLGDITKIDVDSLEPVDIITCSSPCQDLSVAGKREGLGGERSGLFRTAIKLVHGLRERTGKPRFFAWENVCGVFSSNKGLDFRAVLEEITKTEIPMPVNNRWAESGMVEWGASSLAWRTFDSQYWGSAQRRKRIFLVADFRGFTAGEILFERKSSTRNIAESEGKRQKIARNARESTNNTSELELYENHAQDSRVKGPLDVAPTVSATYGMGGNNTPIVLHTNDNSHKCRIIENHPNDSRVKYREDGTVQTLTGRMGTGGGNVPMVHNIAGKVRRLTPTELRIYLQEVDINGAAQGIKALYVLWENYGAKKVCEWCVAIMERIQQAKVLQQGVYEKSVSTETSQGNELDDSSLPCPEYIADWLLRDMWQQQKCGCTPQRWESAEQFARKLNESVQKLSHENPSQKGELCDMWETSKGARLLREAFTEIQKIWESFNVESWRQTKTVRRLTPLEAERLQGLPDSWTDVEYNGKSAPDSKRYKAIGNGMAVPCSDFIMRRIAEVSNGQNEGHD